MPRTDRHGLPVTASSPDTVERWDRAVDSLLHFADDVGDRFEETVADEDGFALGHIGRALLRSMSTERPDAIEAAEILAQVGAGRDLTAREQSLLAAARTYAAGDLAGASERLARHTVEHPTDALALAVGHQIDFFTGDAATLRDRIGRALSSWDDRDPHYGFLLGMLAFGLEESGQYDQALTAGMEAIDRDARDVWAIHAVAHVHEMRAEFGRGARFLEERRPDWMEGSFLNVHNAWHLALFRLEAGDTDTPLRTYDEILHHDGSAGIALEMVDASAMLWRLHLDDVDVGDRWISLADAWAAKDLRPFYAFNDAHAAMAFVGAGRLADARDVVERMRAYATGPATRETNQVITAEVGLPVCEALLAFGEGRYDDAVDHLHPVRARVHRFGGSHAQRDAVARTLLESALRAGRFDLARSLVSERLVVREGSPYTWLRLAELRAATGDGTGAAEATARAEALRRAA